MESADCPRASLSVVIVLYHSPEHLLQRTLDSLRNAVAAARVSGQLDEVTVYLVNNTPAPDYRERIRERISQWPFQQEIPIVYDEPASNLGFGAGNNSVMPLLDSEYHLILNPDVELEEATLARGLARLADEPDIVLLSPWASGSGGEQEFLCKRHPTLLVLMLRGFAPGWLRNRARGLLDDYQMTAECSAGEPVDVPLVSGCFMLTRTAVLHAVGGFDPRYFLYFEDFDLSVRLGEQGRVVFDPALRIVHHGGYAAGKGWRHRWLFLRSAMQFFQAHGWRWI